MSDLKPCPFCGGLTVPSFERYEMTQCGSITCWMSGREMPKSQWNTRPAEAALQKRVEELEKKVKGVEEYCDKIDPNHECVTGQCCALGMVEDITAALKGPQ